MRVSKAKQNLALQHDALLAAGVAPERVYEDICCSTVTSRAERLAGEWMEQVSDADYAEGDTR